MYSNFIIDIRDFTEHGTLTITQTEHFIVTHSQQLAAGGDATQYIRARLESSNSASLLIYTSHKRGTPLLHIFKTTRKTKPYCAISNQPDEHGGSRVKHITFEDVFTGLAALAANLTQQEVADIGN